MTCLRAEIKIPRAVNRARARARENRASLSPPPRFLLDESIRGSL